MSDQGAPAPHDHETDRETSGETDRTSKETEPAPDLVETQGDREKDGGVTAMRYMDCQCNRAPCLLTNACECRMVKINTCTTRCNCRCAYKAPVRGGT